MHDSTYWAKGVFGLFCKIFRKIHNKTVQVENRSGGAGGRGGVGVAKRLTRGGGGGGSFGCEAASYLDGCGGYTTLPLDVSWQRTISVCTNVSFLVLILYHGCVRCDHRGELGERSQGPLYYLATSCEAVMISQ